MTGPPGCGASNPPASEQAIATLTAAPDQSGLFSLIWAAGPVQVSLSGPVLVTAQGQLQLDLQSTMAVGTDTATLTGYGTAFSGQAQVGGAGPCGFTGAVQLTLDGTGLTAVCVATVQDASPSLSPAPAVPPAPGDRKITLHPSSAQVPNPLPVPPGVAADGSLINGMNSVAWSGSPGPEAGGTPGQASGWGGTSPAHVVLGGGHLFFDCRKARRCLRFLPAFHRAPRRGHGLPVRRFASSRR